MPETPHERMPTLERFDRYGEDARTPVPRGRVTMPAGRVLIVLLVDDAHLLDTAQLDALLHLVRRRPRLVLTYRPWPRPPALVELAAVASRTYPSLTLTPFTTHEVATYLAAVWPEAPPPSAVEHICAHTGGVPAFVARHAAGHAVRGTPSGPALRHPPAEALALFTAEQRTKEIGVRKVLGASVSSIVFMLSKDFLKLVLVANLIALPLGWYFMAGWLNDFADRTEMSWWIFAAAFVSTIIIAMFTLSFHAIRTAVANPVTSLRTE